jgi:uncharacterized protein YbjT (DUF2867 family)
VPLSWHNRAVAEPRVLVAGATGRLGQVVVRKLAAAGVPVRALARNRDQLATLAGTNVEIAAVDMNNVPALNAACRGVGQIVATANNNMGSGPASPTRIDLPAYQNLCAAARNAAVRRLIFVSTRSVDQDAPVDLFRVKWYIEDAIRRSGVRYVILRCAAFTDIWVDLIADGIRKKGVTTIFGDGTGVANYIAIDDVVPLALIVKSPRASVGIVGFHVEKTICRPSGCQMAAPIPSSARIATLTRDDRITFASVASSTTCCRIARFSGVQGNQRRAVVLACSFLERTSLYYRRS